MKSFLITFATMTAAAVSAFSTSFVLKAAAVTSSQLFYASTKDRVGTSSSAEVIKAAMEASTKFGVTSPEARAAWETVEEIDSYNSQIVDDSTNAASDLLFNTIMPGGGPRLTTTTKDAELSSKGLTTSRIATRRAKALVEAVAITKEKGIGSTDAHLAWELVEDFAATTEDHHVTFGSG